MTLRRARPFWARKKAGGGGAAFISTWNTANTSTGGSASNQVKLPLDSLGVYNFIVNWGDGNEDTITAWNQSETTHTYASSGTYVITITGTLQGWRINNSGDRLKIIDISSWGDIEFLTNAFWGCTNLQISATDSPILPSNSTNFFRACTLLTGNSSFNNWDLSAVTTLSGFFNGARDFNADISGWDVSSVTDFGAMFQSTNLFNQNIGIWDVSSGSNFGSMFNFARDFNQNIGSWNVSNGASFNVMFLGKNTSTFSTANLDAIYNGWTNRTLGVSKSISFSTAKYTAAGAEGRALLTRANATVSVSNAVNNGSGLIRITTGSAHGLTTGNKIFISGVTGTTEANGAWIVTVINATTIDLQASTFSSAYTSGGTVRTGYGWTITDGGI